jgi:membrane associated rhomboid family serine protease
VNVAVYAWQVFGGFNAQPGGPPGPLESLVLVPGESGVWTWLSYAFLHDPTSVWHILFNMLFLWVFGPVVEDRLSRVGFLAFYLGGAVVAGLAHAASGGGAVIGASGAVSGVTGAALALFPRARIKTIVFFFIIGAYMIPAWFFIGLSMARDILPLLLGRSSNIAYTAHLGGYGYGLAVCLTLLATGVLKREPYDLFSIAKQAKRRRELKAAVGAAERERARKIEIQDRERAKKESPAEKKRVEALAAARSAVSLALAEGRMDDAAEAYATLVNDHSQTMADATLAQRTQYTLATHLYRAGRLELAADAFGRYLAAFPNDPEAPQIRLLLGRVQRMLGNEEEARPLLEKAALELNDERLAAMAREELTLIAPGGSA